MNATPCLVLDALRYKLFRFASYTIQSNATGYLLDEIYNGS